MWMTEFSDDVRASCPVSCGASVNYFGYIDNLLQWQYPWHIHRDQIEIIYVTKGQGEFVIEDNCQKISSGSICVIAPNTLHHFALSGNENMLYYTFHLGVLNKEDSILSFFYSLGNAVTSGINYLEHIRQSLFVLYDLCQIEDETAYSVFRQNLAGLLSLTQFLFTHDSLTMRTPSQCSANEILRYITEHYSEKITLESLSRHFCLSTSHLSRIFYSTYHRSPIQHLIASRIVQATDLLLKTNLSVIEISHIVGYDNPAYFSRLFSKKIGCSPLEYRGKGGAFTSGEKKQP